MFGTTKHCNKFGLLCVQWVTTASSSAKGKSSAHITSSRRHEQANWEHLHFTIQLNKLGRTTWSKDTHTHTHNLTLCDFTSKVKHQVRRARERTGYRAQLPSKFDHGAQSSKGSKADAVWNIDVPSKMAKMATRPLCPSLLLISTKSYAKMALAKMGKPKGCQQAAIATSGHNGKD